MVERHPYKVDVVGSTPAPPTNKFLNPLYYLNFLFQNVTGGDFPKVRKNILFFTGIREDGFLLSSFKKWLGKKFRTPLQREFHLNTDFP